MRFELSPRKPHPFPKGPKSSFHTISGRPFTFIRSKVCVYTYKYIYIYTPYSVDPNSMSMFDLP